MVTVVSRSELVAANLLEKSTAESVTPRSFSTA